MATEEDSDVPGTGAVFTYGKSNFGDNSPNKFWIRDDRVTNIGCGDQHTVFIAESGRVFTLGANEWGQLGLRHNKTVKKPTRIKVLKDEKIVRVACGLSHTVLSTESGKFYSFGSNSDGQLGLGTNDNTPNPTPIEAFSKLGGHTCTSLAAGAHHSGAVLENGDVYMWGSNGDGQCGLGDTEEVTEPTKLPFDHKVVQIACGYYHTALVTDTGELYTFGETDNGKLGRDASDSKTPQRVDGIEGKVSHVSCGGNHNAVVTENGKIYTFGEGANGQLGNGTTLLSVEKPVALALPNRTKVKKACCGDNHTAFITERGRLYVFGDGRHGKLALGDENFANQFFPNLVQRFSQFYVEEVSCGGCHTLMIAKPRLENGDVVSEDEFDEGEDEEETEQPSHFKRGEWNGSVRSSMDLNGSFQARHRRREKLPDPGDTINRTMPPLTNSMATRGLEPLSATLPPLGGQGSNPLNHGKLPSLYSKTNGKTMNGKHDNDEKDDDSVSVTPENSDTEGSGPFSKTIRRQTMAATKSAPPLAKPRPIPRKAGKIQPMPVPAVRGKPRFVEHSDESDEDKKKHKESDKDSGEESEEEEKPEKSKKKTKKSPKKEKKKEPEKPKGGLFGRKKVAEEESEEEESDEEKTETPSEEDEKPSKSSMKKDAKKAKTKKEGKKGKKKESDSEDEDSEEDKKGKKKSSRKNVSEDEDFENEKKSKKKAVKKYLSEDEEERNVTPIKKKKMKEQKAQNKKKLEKQESETESEDEPDTRKKEKKSSEKSEDESESDTEEKKKKEETKPQQQKKSRSCAIL